MASSHTVAAQHLLTAQRGAVHTHYTLPSLIFIAVLFSNNHHCSHFPDKSQRFAELFGAEVVLLTEIPEDNKGRK